MICMICTNDLAHVAGWEPCNLHNLGHVSLIGSTILHRSAQHLITTGEDLHGLRVDLSNVQHFMESIRRLYTPHENLPPPVLLQLIYPA